MQPNDDQKEMYLAQIRQSALRQATSTLKYPYTAKDLIKAAKEIEKYLLGKTK